MASAEAVAAVIAAGGAHVPGLMDVLEAAELRRGRPTVVAAAGRAIATATGDLLFSRAFAELARNGRPESVRVLSDASSALAEGELLQREDSWNIGVSRERYEQRCDLKTARLFQAACELGALGELDLRAVRTPEQAEAVCDAIAATGVLEAARATALNIVAAAKADLPVLPEAQQIALELVADGVADRYA